MGVNAHLRNFVGLLGLAGGIAAKFALNRFDAREGRLRTLALVLTAVSVLVMGSLMGLAVHWIVKRPIGRFMRAIEAVDRKEPAAVNLKSADEFGVLTDAQGDALKVTAGRRVSITS